MPRQKNKNHFRLKRTQFETKKELKRSLDKLESTLHINSEDPLKPIFQEYKKKLLAQPDKRKAILTLREVSKISKRDLNQVKKIILNSTFNNQELPYLLFKQNSSLYNIALSIYQYCGIVISRGKLYLESIHNIEKFVNLAAASFVIYQAANNCIHCATSLSILGISLGSNLLLNYLVKANNNSNSKISLLGILSSNIISQIINKRIFNLLNIGLYDLYSSFIEDDVSSYLLAYVTAGILTTQLSRIQQGLEIMFTGKDEIKNNLNRQIHSNLYDIAKNNTHMLLNFCLKLIINSEALALDIFNNQEFIRPFIALGQLINSKVRDTIANQLNTKDNDISNNKRDYNYSREFTLFMIYYIRTYIKPLTLEQVCSPIDITQDIKDVAIKTTKVLLPAQIVEQCCKKLGFNSQKLKVTETIKSIVVG